MSPLHHHPNLDHPSLAAGLNGEAALINDVAADAQGFDKHARHELQVHRDQIEEG